MDTLLSELKQHSTLLYSSSLDFEDLKPLDNVPPSSSSQSSSFFNFSYLPTTNQPTKSFNEMFNSVTPTATPQAPLHTTPQSHPRNQWSFDMEDFTPSDSVSKETNQEEDKEGKSIIPLSAPQVGCSYEQLFPGFGMPSNTQSATGPKCEGNEYYSNFNERNTEDFFFNRQSPFGYFGFPQAVKKSLVQDAIEVNKKIFDFGVHLPGKILEECLEITNKTSQSLSVEVVVDCANPELKDSKEYIYSIRSNQAYDYSETRQFILSPNSTATFKVALKVPAIRLDDKITGKVTILVQNHQGECTIDLSSKVVMPKITCPKQLYSQALKRSFVNVAIKKGKTQEKNISLKNDSDVPVVLELGFYKPSSDAGDCDFECSVYPKVLTIPPKNSSTTTVLFKFSKSAVQAENGTKSGAKQKVLYGKAQDSSLVYSFALWVETF